MPPRTRTIKAEFYRILIVPSTVIAKELFSRLDLCDGQTATLRLNEVESLQLSLLKESGESSYYRFQKRLTFLPPNDLSPETLISYFQINTNKNLLVFNKGRFGPSISDLNKLIAANLPGISVDFIPVFYPDPYKRLNSLARINKMDIRIEKLFTLPKGSDSPDPLDTGRLLNQLHGDRIEFKISNSSRRSSLDISAIRHLIGDVFSDNANIVSKFVISGVDYSDNNLTIDFLNDKVTYLAKFRLDENDSKYEPESFRLRALDLALENAQETF